MKNIGAFKIRMEPLATFFHGMIRTLKTYNFTDYSGLKSRSKPD